MTRKLLPLFFLLFFSFYSKGQVRVADSLVITLKNYREDTSKIEVLFRISDILSKEGAKDKSLLYANSALVLSTKLDFKSGIAKANNAIGVYYKNSGNANEALKKHFAALTIAKEINNERIIASTYRQIGAVYIDITNFKEALNYSILCLKLSEKIGFKKGISGARINIGTVYSLRENYEEALKNYKAAIKVEEEMGNKYTVGVIYNNIGLGYVAQKKYSEALKNFNVMLKIAIETKNRVGMQMSYNNIGLVYDDENNYPEALKNYFSALKLAEELGNKANVSTANVNIGNVYLNTKKYNLAREYFDRSLSISKTIGNIYLKKIAYYNLSILDSAIGDMNGAYKYYKLYAQVEDSIFNEESAKQISQIKIQYETEKKDNQIETQNLQIEAQVLESNILKVRIFYSIAIGLMVAGIIALLYYLSHLRNKRKKKEYEHMLTDLELAVLKAQLNPHFISNSLSTIKAFIDQQPEKASQFLAKFARLMRMVLQQTEKSVVPLKEELDTVELYMQIESLRIKHGFDYFFDYEPSLDIEGIMVPPLILQPTVENAIWHGLVARNEPGYIKIIIRLEGDLLKFTIENDGSNQHEFAASSIQNPERKSFGMAITRKRIEILSKELKKEGYYNLNMLNGKTIAEIALPVNYS